MAIDPSAIGAVTEPTIYDWTDRDTLLYALGVGAGIEDLAFTTENSHDIPQQVLPTFAVICCMGFGAAPLVGGFNWGKLLHGSQEVRLSAPLPPSGALSVVAEVADIQDKGEGKNAIIMLRARGSDPATGAAIKIAASTRPCSTGSPETAIRCTAIRGSPGNWRGSPSRSCMGCAPTVSPVGRCWPNWPAVTRRS